MRAAGSFRICKTMRAYLLATLYGAMHYILRFMVRCITYALWCDALHTLYGAMHYIRFMVRCIINNS